MRARDAKLHGDDPKQAAEDARMMALYRQHILGEKPAAEGFVPLGKVAPATKNEAEELIAGD